MEFIGPDLNPLLRNLNDENARVAKFLDSLIKPEPTPAPQMKDRPAREKADEGERGEGTK